LAQRPEEKRKVDQPKTAKKKKTEKEKKGLIPEKSSAK